MSHRPNAYLALPIRAEMWLCKNVAHVISPLARLEVDQSAPVVDAHAVIRTERRSDMELLRWVGDTGMTSVPFRVPRDVQVVTAMASYQHLFFAGALPRSNPTSRLGFYDLRAHRPAWMPVDLPDTLGQIGPISALSVDHDRLIAIDSSFTPKLLHEFALAGEEPEYLRSVRIPSGIDDVVQGIAVGRSYVAILSSTRQADGKAWKIGIYDRVMFDEVSTFFHRVPWEEPLHAPTQIAFLEDLLLVSHGILGVGIARLQDSSPTRFEHVRATQPWIRPFIPLSSFRYHTPLSSGRVTAVIPLTDESAVVAVIRRGNQTWWERISL